MKYWLFTIDSLINTFSLVEAGREIKYKFKMESNTEDGKSLAALNMGDVILGYVNEPINQISYLFEVIRTSGEEIQLRKTLERYQGTPLASIQLVDESLYHRLVGFNQQQLFELTKEQYGKLKDLFLHGLDQGEKKQEDQVNETNETYLAPTKNPKAANMPYNRIVFGAPGTGKSHKLEQERLEYFGSNLERVTFHQNYSYGQFVGTYKPKPVKGTTTISYELVPGPFLRIFVNAMEHRNRNYVLVVEEINRANTAAVFGDIFQLLDRDDDGKSEYSIMVSEDIKEYLEEKTKVVMTNNEMYIPENLYIWSTMNTADQGVYPIDSAFKRRFDFEYIGINENEKQIESYVVNIIGVGKINWNAFRKALNDFLLAHVRNMKEDKLIGPFFIKSKSLKADDHHFNEAFKNKLLMYLSEDVFKTANKTVLFKYLSYSKTVEEFDEKRNIFSDDFLEKLQPLILVESDAR